MEKHTPYEQIKCRPFDFIVKYRFYDDKENGRKTDTPVQGYRSDFMYAEDEVQNKQEYKIWMIHPEFIDQENQVILDKTIPVQQTGIAHMWIVNEQFYEMHKERIKVGQKGFFMEGVTKTAECEVVELVRLKYSKLFIESLSFITAIAKENKARYKVSYFPSDCIMVDVWHKDRFFVIQLEIENGKEYFGLSEVTENETDFTSRAERYYDTPEEFKKIFSNLLKK